MDPVWSNIRVGGLHVLCGIPKYTGDLGGGMPHVPWWKSGWAVVSAVSFVSFQLCLCQKGRHGQEVGGQHNH